MSLFKRANQEVKITLRAKSKSRKFHITRGLKDDRTLRNQIIIASASVVGLAIVPLLLQKAYLQGFFAWIKDEMQRHQMKTEFYTKEDYSWYAGGDLYNECFAGGRLFNPSGLETPFDKITNSKPIFNGDEKILEQIQLPYSSLAGGDGFYENITNGTIVGRFINA